MIKFICYPKCTTCRKAKKWLDDNKIEYMLRDIKEDNPSFEELYAWHVMSGLPLKKFFNTSGLLYKSMELKDKLQKENIVLADDLSLMIDQSGASATGKKKDAEDALTVLGYSRSEVSATLRGIDTEKLELDDIIRLALKKLMR